MAKKREAKRPASYFIDFENVRGAGLDGVENLGKHDKVFVLFGGKDSTLKVTQVQNILASPASVKFIKVATGKHDALDFQLVALLFMNMKKKREYYIISKDTGFDFAIRMAKARGIERVFRRESIAGATVELKQLPQPRRSRAKRLPQPKDAVPAANSGKGEQDASAEQVETKAQEDTANPQPSRSSRRRRRKSSTARAAKAAKAAKDPYRVEVERVLARHLGGLPVAKKVDILLAALEKTDTKGRLYNFLRGNLGNEEGLSFYRDVKGCIDDLRAIERPARPEEPDAPAAAAESVAAPAPETQTETPE